MHSTVTIAHVELDVEQEQSNMEWLLPVRKQLSMGLTDYLLLYQYHQPPIALSLLT